MRPYPWTTERKQFPDQQRLGNGLRRFFGWPLTVIAFLLCPLSLLVPLWSQVGFRRTNDSWWKRGTAAVIAGGLISLATFRLGEWAHAWNVALESFGSKATVPTKEAVIQAFSIGLGPALLLAGVSSICWCYYTEYHSFRFLYRTRPTWTARLRRRTNTKRLRSGAGLAKGFVPFGVIVDDPIPWRTPGTGGSCSDR